METFSIGEVAHTAGIATSAIRYYEQVGLLPPSKRVNGKRRYDSAILSKLKIIRLAQQAGFTIAEIHMLLHGFPAEMPPFARWQALAQQKRDQVEALIQNTLHMKNLLDNSFQCTCARLEDCELLIDNCKWSESTGNKKR